MGRLSGARDNASKAEWGMRCCSSSQGKGRVENRDDFFFVNEHLVFFCPIEKKMYFVSFSFLNSKKSKDSFIVY